MEEKRIQGPAGQEYGIPSITDYWTGWIDTKLTILGRDKLKEQNKTVLTVRYIERIHKAVDYSRTNSEGDYGTNLTEGVWKIQIGKFSHLAISNLMHLEHLGKFKKFKQAKLWQFHSWRGNDRGYKEKRGVLEIAEEILTF